MQIIPAGGQARELWLRMVIWGGWKSGKTTLAASFPAPILIHPLVESGYDTVRRGQQYLCAVLPLGETHAMWMQGKGGVPVSEELFAAVQSIYLGVKDGSMPYKTIVLGGFSMFQKLVIEEMDRRADSMRKGKEKDLYRKWGLVLEWATRMAHVLFTIPAHVIIELNQKERTEGGLAVYEPDLAGQTQNIFLNDANVVVFQQATPIGYFTHFRATPGAMAAPRFSELWGGVPVQNCCYDYFADHLGLPPIWVADPFHPRCQPRAWPWDCHWHV